MKKHSEETRIVHGIDSSCLISSDLVPPIHMTSTYRFDSAEHGCQLFSGERKGHVYTRISNPTVDMLQDKMALLEGGESAIATSSGMASIAAAALTLAKPGDNFVACNSLYGGTFSLFNTRLRGLRISPHFIAPSESNSRQYVYELLDKNTKFMYLETPANPTLDVIDIELWASISKDRNIPLIVDNTFPSPYLQKPLKLGADIVVHSATKYLGGHGDIVGGIIVGSDQLMNRIKEEYMRDFGPGMSPFNAWLILRGIKTLALRMDRHSASAVKIASWLENASNVTRVYYPGLKSHPNHQLAEKQMKRPGGMIAFEVKGGIESGKKVLNSLELCILAVSLGDCETLIQHPPSMTHSTYTKEEREKAGISDGLIRLSVGLENADDIIADIENALSRV